MAQRGFNTAPNGDYPDRKAHASLAHVEGRLLEGMSKANPDLLDPDGSCPQCVALEHMLADEYHAHAAASQLTGS